MAFFFSLDIISDQAKLVAGRLRFLRFSLISPFRTTVKHHGGGSRKLRGPFGHLDNECWDPRSFKGLPRFDGEMWQASGLPILIVVPDLCGALKERTPSVPPGTSSSASPAFWWLLSILMLHCFGVSRVPSLASFTTSFFLRSLSFQSAWSGRCRWRKLTPFYITSITLAICEKQMIDLRKSQIHRVFLVLASRGF